MQSSVLITGIAGQESYLTAGLGLFIIKLNQPTAAHCQPETTWWVLDGQQEFQLTRGVNSSIFHNKTNIYNLVIFQKYSKYLGNKVVAWKVLMRISFTDISSICYHWYELENLNFLLWWKLQLTTSTQDLRKLTLIW